ncbi:hypothetical protein THASP1DRAFT_24749 [Thamnocephalis sphaerospora]|uniref:SAM domain-containing protein n=1 Tax=Thamnocephalis sphaerospora TaxID=78915 RepID=A0A4P9XMC3_9FUNG|nr:hypothetical protein THASP1DRAFT_24749 [Thamnocephalis sphaerospora]|eukprot:RKP07025.1 hypothetical protein THASP1DRAFT_24749 [Thamnocephalis sphaerospora]
MAKRRDRSPPGDLGYSRTTPNMEVTEVNIVKDLSGSPICMDERRKKAVEDELSINAVQQMSSGHDETMDWMNAAPEADSIRDMPSNADSCNRGSSAKVEGTSDVVATQQPFLEGCTLTADPMHWTPMQVAHWLHSKAGIASDYCQEFIEQEVDGQVLLLDIDESTLRTDLGITKLGVRKKIWRAISMLQRTLEAGSKSDGGCDDTAADNTNPAKRRRLDVSVQDDRLWSNPLEAPLAISAASVAGNAVAATAKLHYDSVPPATTASYKKHQLDNSKAWLPDAALEDVIPSAQYEGDTDAISDSDGDELYFFRPPSKRSNINIVHSPHCKVQLRGKAEYIQPSDMPVHSGDALAKFRVVVGHDTAGALVEEDDDEILPLYGDSDFSDADLDAALAQEIRKEKADKPHRSAVRGPAAGRAKVNVERIEELLKEHIELVRTHWIANRLCKLEARKRRIYERGQGRLQEKQAELQHLRAKRLRALMRSIRTSSYYTERDIIVACGALDRSLERIYELDWVVKLLQLPQAPSKTAASTAAAAPRQPKAAKASTSTAQTTSHSSGSDTDDIDDFIDDTEMDSSAPFSGSSIWADLASANQADTDSDDEDMLPDISAYLSLPAGSLETSPDPDHVTPQPVMNATEPMPRPALVATTNTNMLALADNEVAASIRQPISTQPNAGQQSDVTRAGASKTHTFPSNAADRQKAPNNVLTRKTAVAPSSESSSIAVPVATPVSAPSTSHGVRRGNCYYGLRASHAGQLSRATHYVFRAFRRGAALMALPTVQVVHERLMSDSAGLLSIICGSFKHGGWGVQTARHRKALVAHTKMQSSSNQSTEIANKCTNNLSSEAASTAALASPNSSMLRKATAQPPQSTDESTPRNQAHDSRQQLSGRSAVQQADENAQAGSAHQWQYRTDSIAAVSSKASGGESQEKTGDSATRTAPKVRTQGRRDIREIRKEDTSIKTARRVIKRKHDQVAKRVAALEDAGVYAENSADQPTIINLGHPDGEPDVYIDGSLARYLKPHQTFQIITFLYTYMSELADRPNNMPAHLQDGRVLILCPPTVMDNWIDEFNQWIAYDLRQKLRGLYTVSFYVPKSSTPLTAGSDTAEYCSLATSFTANAYGTLPRKSSSLSRSV